MFFCGFFAIKNTQNADALNSGTIGSATKIGGGEDLWDSGKGRMNGIVFADLMNKLFNIDMSAVSAGTDVKQSTVSYISGAIIDADNGVINDSGSKVITANAINAKVGNADYGAVIKLGGLDWIITSLTLDTSNRPIMTLYLADYLADENGIIRSAFLADNTRTDSNIRGRSIYSCSTLRNNILNNYVQLALFANNSDGSFATKYLVQPKYIAYQRNQTITGRGAGGNNQHNPNEALVRPTSGWNNNSNYGSGTTSFDHRNYGGLYEAYDAWGSDYIWIPSVTEVGGDGSVGAPTQAMPSEDTIWQLSSKQRTPGLASWFRSGCRGNYYSAYNIQAAGIYGGTCVINELGVRPAIHLNLNAVFESAAVPLPQDGTVTYNGKNQTLADVKDNNGKCIYDSDLLGDDCRVTYYDEDDFAANPKDAGTYTVTCRLSNGLYFLSDNSIKYTYETKLTVTPKELKVNFEISTDTQQPTATLEEGEKLLEDDTANFQYRYFNYDGVDYGQDKDGNDRSLEESGTTDTTKLIKGKKYWVSVEFDNSNYTPKGIQQDWIVFRGQPINITWKDGVNSSVYNGGPITFYLDGSEEDLKCVTISLTEASKNKGAQQTSSTVFKATNAGKYSVVLELKNGNEKGGIDDKYCWGAEMGKDAAYKDGAITLEFEITPKELVLKYVNMNNGWDWCPTEGTTNTVYFVVPNLCSGDAAIEVMIYAQYTDNSSKLEVLKEAISVGTTVNAEYRCEFITDNIETLNKGHTLSVEVCNKDSTGAGNYTFKLDANYTFTVKESPKSGGFVWRLLEKENEKEQLAGTLTDRSGTTEFTWNKTITYNKKAFSFIADPTGIGYTVDSSYNSNGFVNGYKTVKKDTTDPLTSVTNAGTYITTVRLKDSAGSAHDYKIEWTIDKAKYDLSNLHWIDDGKLSYDDRGIRVELVESSIPDGLKPQYSGTRTANNVGDKGTAFVAFTVSEEYAENYIVPVAGDESTYIFNKSDTREDFDWEMKWAVNAREIPVVWTVGTLTVDETIINAEMLSGGFGDYIEYVYYETNSNGEKLENAQALTVPEVTENKIRFYIAEVRIKEDFEGNYVFDSKASETDLISPVFEVGHVLTGVQLTAKKTEYIYWGQAVKFQYTATGVVDSAFKVEYFSGMTSLGSNAPTDPGEYRVELGLKNDYAKNYYIDGTNGVWSCDFKIVRATITISWDENVKPPRLILNENQKKYVDYVYRDSSGNEFKDISELRTPDNYTVYAKITDNSKYIFFNGAEYSEHTDWVKFTVKSGDAISDPSTSAPQLPTTDPNDPNGGGNTGTQKNVSVWLSSYSAQVGSAGAQVGNSAGLPENAFIVSWTLNGKPVSDFSVAGVYQAVISLRPEYAGEWTLTGTTTYSYVVTGNAVDGATTPNGNGTGDNPSDSTIVTYLPIILSGVSLVLIIVFAVMAFNNASAAKEAKAKTKKLAAISYSVSPMGLLALMFGLSEGNWWIIAGVLMGLALLTAVAAFMLKGKKKKALAELEEEQTRVAEEKEYAKEEKLREEQQRRDNELRMMLASMQQNYQQQPFNYDALQSAIASSMTALLPGLQQQMALPPASFNVDASISADAQKEIDGLHAQIAKQQELLTQILENQQNYVMPLYEEDYVEDDISWLGDSEELISLEESYGALSDEGKRFYYEVGSYIMNKSRTSQNDGRYAVLFKYRGRTVFKLCIKDDAPVLYYPAGGGRAEVRVANSTALELAKSVIDRQTAKVDSELN